MVTPPDNPKPGQPAQNGAIEIPSTNSKDQPESKNKSNARDVTALISYQCSPSLYECIRWKCAYIVRKRYRLSLNSAELLALVSLCGYIEYNGNDIVSLTHYIDYFLHASKFRANLTGALRGLLKFGCITLFEKKNTGTRFIGVTPYGEQLNDIFFLVINELQRDKQKRRFSLAYKEDNKFWIVPNAHELESLTVDSITTKNKHLFNPSKYEQ